MGLDFMEFIMELEEEFGFQLPDAVGERMRTPRDLADYIESVLPEGNHSPAQCASQRVFYRIRTAIRERLGLQKYDVRPRTCLDDIIPRENRHLVWSQIGTASLYPNWPALHFTEWRNFRYSTQFVRRFIQLLCVAWLFAVIALLPISLGAVPWVVFPILFLLVGLSGLMILAAPYFDPSQRTEFAIEGMTVGDTVHAVLNVTPAWLINPPAPRSRNDIEQTILELMNEHFGKRNMSLDDQFMDLW